LQSCPFCWNQRAGVLDFRCQIFVLDPELHHRTDCAGEIA
jgi:hypothetical protein